MDSMGQDYSSIISNKRQTTGLTHFTPALDCLIARYGPITAVVYGYIWRRSQGERGRCDASRSTIKRLLHIDEKTFTNHARILARDGYLSFQERGNSSTIYWPTGKAEKENADFSVEILPTKRNSSVEILPGSGEDFPAQQGGFPRDEREKRNKETINDSAKKKGGACKSCDEPISNLSPKEIFQEVCRRLQAKYPDARHEWVIDTVQNELPTISVDQFHCGCDFDDVAEAASETLELYIEHGGFPLFAFPDLSGKASQFVF